MHESPLKVLFNRHNKYIIFLKSANFAPYHFYKSANLALFRKMIYLLCLLSSNFKGDSCMNRLFFAYCVSIFDFYAIPYSSFIAAIICASFSSHSSMLPA